jgi:hypothetical protein
MTQINADPRLSTPRKKIKENLRPSASSADEFRGILEFAGTGSLKDFRSCDQDFSKWGMRGRIELRAGVGHRAA